MFPKATLYSLGILLALCSGACSFVPTTPGGGTAALLQPNVENDPVLEYAQSEIEKFLAPEYLADAGKHGVKSIKIEFARNASLPEAAFSVSFKTNGDGTATAAFEGHSSSDILAAVYTFLEKGGYFFDITGVLAPKHFDWEAVKGFETTIVPSVKARGIRQHLNFPMDLSAWSAEAAKKYIRNLARMRFNAIVFHSYPGQWYAVKHGDKMEYAGHFFYGDVHLVPPYPPIRKIAVNKKYFCVPEIEPDFENEAKRSGDAIKWLRELMLEAKKVGMRVDFSFEPRETSADLDRSLETVRAVLKEYPMIDSLEFITEEIGGGRKGAFTSAKTKKILSELFGKESLKDPAVAKSLEFKKTSMIGKVYAQAGHIVKLVKYLENGELEKLLPPDAKKKPVLRIGIYSVFPRNTAPVYRLLRKTLPDTTVALLCGHHSSRVAGNAKKILSTPEDWAKTSIYSWIEFDGLMYLQQNAASGIHALLAEAAEKAPEHRAASVLFNHWRTAENKVAARYAAEATLDAALAPTVFYKKYAKAHGIDNTDAFAEAMSTLDASDLYMLHHGFGSIGFCWVGRWRSTNILCRGKAANLNKAIENFEKVSDALKRAGNAPALEPEARKLLSFLDNRVRSSVVFFRAFQKGAAIKPLLRKADKNPETKKLLREKCDEGIAELLRYIDIYAEKNEDRGCAGQLISLWAGPLKCFKQLRKEKCGVPFDEKIAPGTAVDAPPIPAISK